MQKSPDRAPEQTSPALPDAVVPSDVYTEHYFRHCNAGFEEWQASEGTRFAGIYAGILDMARFKPGELLVDVGTGRGEMLAAAVERSAARAIGIDYARAAVELARKTLDVQRTGSKAVVMHADSRAIPVASDVADLVTMVDVVEHLAPAELDRTLREVERILKPGGRVFIHTAPNRTMYNVTYRLQRLARPSRLRRWPVDPRIHDEERQMHVNEQTVSTMRRYLQRAGFDTVRAWVGRWVYTDFVPDARAKNLYRFLARLRLTRRFGVGDLFAEATKG